MNQNGGVDFGEVMEESKEANFKSFKELKKEQRNQIRKDVQKIKDEYGSEAYFCGSSCSECDAQNHVKSELNESFKSKVNSQNDLEESKEE